MLYLVVHKVKVSFQRFIMTGTVVVQTSISDEILLEYTSEFSSTFEKIIVILSNQTSFLCITINTEAPLLLRTRNYQRFQLNVTLSSVLTKWISCVARNVTIRLRSSFCSTLSQNIRKPRLSEIYHLEYFRKEQFWCIYGINSVHITLGRVKIKC
jgi:hypothetical protein